VHHLIWTHLEERNELGVLVIGGSPLMHTLFAALAPLWRNALGGTSKVAAGVPEAIAGVRGEADRAAVLVAWDSHVYIGRASGCTLYHYHGGQLYAIPDEKPPPLAIAPGNWIAATCGESSVKMDLKTVQGDMAKAYSAAQLAQAWAERGGAVVVALKAI
jgi:hypothetical protein